ncbi:MAG: globin domain-containing protein [Corynebacterium casei]|uniref:globin domain-containing protein n=1 Tax=Corynebacterium casei TaxID=160386 RepID=UPI0009CD137D|nr:globin domain-containing protein [Corynebacterium casei]MDN5707640.1 globin domain-containing protein [Corynebacterium casei]MDN5784897.1 globin domain-containing protein [Corynebacterium casei]MDN5800020.1 globin domain-containing protein [Corynebacterium casei]MDN5840994.1 globin domain-containing protein [Corynebacterium casei]MDN5903768.1 globin domain-containing protein [Corynebacterium casei]
MFVTSKPDTKAKRLSPEHEQIIIATLPAVGEQIETIAHTFYGKMFSAHPELLRDTFNRGNQKSGEQQKALAASIATFATMLVDENAPDPVDLLNRIAHKHVSLGITEDQYQVVHDNLLPAVAEVLGEAVTPKVAEAWSAVYWIMAEVLIEHEKVLYASDGVENGDVFRDAKVIAKNVLTERVTEYVLVGDFTEPQPGQYTSIGVKLADGARQLRQYSIIGGDATQYRIAVETDGEVSNHLRQHIEVGDTIQATLAAGELVLQASERPAVLISSGIGSTPMVGMLAHLAQNNANREVLYLHADDSAETWAQEGHIRALAGQLDNCQLVAAQRSAGELLDVTAHNLVGADVYICGGNNFLQAIRSNIDSLDDAAKPASVSFELFSPNDWLIR